MPSAFRQRPAQPNMSSALVRSDRMLGHERLAPYWETTAKPRIWLALRVSSRSWPLLRSPVRPSFRAPTRTPRRPSQAFLKGLFDHCDASKCPNRCMHPRLSKSENPIPLTRLNPRRIRKNGRPATPNLQRGSWACEASLTAKPTRHRTPACRFTLPPGLTGSPEVQWLSQDPLRTALDAPPTRITDALAHL